LPGASGAVDGAFCALQSGRIANPGTFSIDEQGTKEMKL
jgi:hypothetical protein